MIDSATDRALRTLAAALNIPSDLPPATGLNHWRGNTEEAEAIDRYHDALARGFSDYEAREEGWPTA